ncbi:MAG: hypothetical protein Q9182_001790 [Xanthomendoza sp. 2 TL-2023]
MGTDGSAYSQTLHGITNIKLEELAKDRTNFQQQHQQLLEAVQLEPNGVARLGILSAGIKSCFSISTSAYPSPRGTNGHSRVEIDVQNLDRFLVQARCDPSLSQNTLEKWQQIMLRHLQTQSLKFDYASLYGQLTTEWLSAKREPAAATGDEDAQMETFEHVPPSKKLEVRLKWEKSAFEPVAVNQAAINDMLHSLFESTPDYSRHLLRAMEVLRKQVEGFERELASSSNFHPNSLRWTIKSLLSSDLLDDSKRDALRDFLGNEIILKELADVLNMRMAALDNWTWGSEVLLEERRQLSGNLNIYMQEDVIQAIFLQYIGIRWSVFWKKALGSFRKSPGVWKSSQTSIPTLDRKRREFYLGAVRDYPSVNSKRLIRYLNGYFLSQLLDAENHEANDEEGEEEADIEGIPLQQGAPRKRKMQAPGHMQAPRQMQAARVHAQAMAQSAARTQQASASSTAPKAIPSLIEHEGTDYKPKNAMEAKQNLLHLLSTDILVTTRIHGTITCFRSQVDALYPSLPHDTINIILQFFGVSARWTRFFDRFLKAPLRFMDEKEAEPRQRKNGTPGSHVLSAVFGELVLFCLDFQINQETGKLLWRLRDDFWFWSDDHTTCDKAWTIIQRFMKTMGLKINEARTGAVRMARKANGLNEMLSLDVGKTLPNGPIRWGMLYLNPDSGRFEIDQNMVDKHIDELSRQLEGKRSSIISWVQAWNSYAANFFASNFGTPANCFGRQHIDNILATHKRIQQRIFSSSSTTATSDPQLSGGGGSVIEYLKQTIKQRFGVSDIPDGYFYFPPELGCLDLRNPFIPLLQLRPTIPQNPHSLLDRFQTAEKDAYRAAKHAYDNNHTPLVDPHFRPDGETRDFFTFEEYTKYREEVHYGFEFDLQDTYTALLEKHGGSHESGDGIIENHGSGEIKLALNSLGAGAGEGGVNLRGILSDWYAMEPYWKWVVQLYGPEMIAKFGGLRVVEAGLLPMGMVGLVRGGGVKWLE